MCYYSLSPCKSYCVVIFSIGLSHRRCRANAVVDAKGFRFQTLEVNYKLELTKCAVHYLYCMVKSAEERQAKNRLGKHNHPQTKHHVPSIWEQDWLG